MANSSRPRWPLRAMRWLGFTTLAIVALVGISWLAVPPLVKHVLQQQIDTQIGRKSRIGAIDFNPLALELTMSDFILYEQDKVSAAFSAKSLLLQVSPSALLRLAPLIDRVQLINPNLHLVRTGSADIGHYNFSDVITRILAMPKSDKPTLFSLANIELKDGLIHFDDRVNARQVRIEALNIGVPFVSNFPEKVDTFVQPRLSAKVNGSPFALKGRAKPFAGSLQTALAIDIEQLDLASYMAFSPVALPVAIRSATLSTKLDLSFVRKQGKPEVVLSGTMQLADLMLADLADAPLLKAREIQVQLSQFDVFAGLVALDKVAILQPEVWMSPAAGDLFRAERIDLDKASVNVDARTVSADALRLAMLQGEVRREADGKLNVRQFSTRFGAGAGAPAPAVKTEPDWSTAIKQFSLSESALTYIDNAVQPAFKLRSQALKLTLDDVSSKLDKPIKVELLAQLNQSGKLKLDGSIAPQFKAVDLAIDAENLSLVALQPYFADYLNVTLASGQASTKGKLALVPATAQHAMQSSYNGMLSLANFRVLDKDNAADFLKWRSLDIGGIDVKVGGPRQEIALDKIALSDFYARIILSESGTLNLQNIVAAKKAPAGAPVPSLTSVEPAALPPKTLVAGSDADAAAVAAKAEAPLIKIGQFVMKGGNINYTDNFVKPNYTANITGMNGTVGAIASNSTQAAPVDVSGKIDNEAAVAIAGSLNPLSTPMFLDIKASANGVELPRLTPYAAKYAGYAIEKGKLSMAVNYRVENDKLVAQNDVRIDQLTFGDKIDSPTATKLPVLLALAMLKDRNGQININLPISGSLSDPEFSLGGIIGRIFLNLITKAVTSPFALLGSIFGGGEELGYAEFLPGSASLTAASQSKLDAIGKALTERPALKLDVTGRVDPQADADGVRQQILMSKLNAFKRKESLDQGVESQSEDVVLSDAEKEKYMGKVYAAQKIEKARNVIGLLKSLPTAEMEKLILANTPVTQEALKALAGKRAEAVRSYFESKGNIVPARIFLIAPKLTTEGISDKGVPSRVDFALK